MKTLGALLLFSTIIFSSCIKCEKPLNKQDADYYYSEDYRDGDGTVLGIDVEEIDVLYAAFYYEGKTLKYKLVANDDAATTKEGKVLAYHEGIANVSKNLDIQFVPSDGSESYSGSFKDAKSYFEVTLPELDNRSLTFQLKK